MDKIKWKFLFYSKFFISLALIFHYPITKLCSTSHDTPTVLGSWAKLEQNFIQNLRTLNSTQTLDVEFLNHFYSYLQDYDDSLDLQPNGTRQNTLATIRGSPIVSYRILRRLVKLGPSLTPFLSPIGQWPTMEDLNEGMMGILRIQHFYNLDAISISQGILAGQLAGGKLNGLHCYEIGLYAHTQNLHSLAVEWLHLALDKIKLNQTLDENTVTSALAMCVDRHDEQFDLNGPLSPYFFDEKLKLAPTIPRKRRETLVEAYKGNKERQFNDLNFWTLCTDGSIQTVQEKSKSVCWLEIKIHNFFHLAPLKMELLAREPDVVQIYGLLNDETIKEIKLIAQPQLKRSVVVLGNSTNAPSPIRTSHSTFVDDRLYSALRTLAQKIELITGLNVAHPQSSQILQVARYSPGEYYGVHQDVSRVIEYGGVGNRVATFMFYLNDVPLGGRTAFVTAGAVAEPIKGSGVFWYNQHSDGTPDESTFHGACPVILGEKWVANKWINLESQWMTRPCSRKSPKERFHINFLAVA